MPAQKGTKEYRAPSVESFGTISDLTAGGSGILIEANATGTNPDRAPIPRS